jgi:hypothetical protein
LLRRLARHVLDADDPADVPEQLRTAATNAAALVTSRRTDRASAAIVLSVSAQAAGLDIIRTAFRAGGV